MVDLCSRDDVIPVGDAVQLLPAVRRETPLHLWKSVRSNAEVRRKRSVPHRGEARRLFGPGGCVHDVRTDYAEQREQPSAGLRVVLNNSGNTRTLVEETYLEIYHRVPQKVGNFSTN